MQCKYMRDVNVNISGNGAGALYNLWLYSDYLPLIIRDINSLKPQEILE